MLNVYVYDNLNNRQVVEYDTKKNILHKTKFKM